MIRPAKPKSKRVVGHDQWAKPVPGEALAVRLVISKITNGDGDVVAEWYFESFFKLLKSAGHQLESWEQETARATFAQQSPI